MGLDEGATADDGSTVELAVTETDVSEGADEGEGSTDDSAVSVEDAIPEVGNCDVSDTTVDSVGVFSEIDNDVLKVSATLLAHSFLSAPADRLTRSMLKKWMVR
jgi:hypothetical protein